MPQCGQAYLGTSATGKRRRYRYYTCFAHSRYGTSHIGLDDKTWWSYAPDNPEGLATFFVAVSRAKQRIVITHCSQRGSRTQVAPLFDLLRAAGVPEADLTVPALSHGPGVVSFRPL